MTLNDLDFEYAHQKLGMILRSVLDMIMLSYWLISILYGCNMQQNQKCQIVKHFDFDLTCDVISDHEINKIRFPWKIFQIYLALFEIC